MMADMGTGVEHLTCLAGLKSPEDFEVISHDSFVRSNGDLTGSHAE